MFTFETTDQKEVRRFRIAQFNGRTATVRSGGSTVTANRKRLAEIDQTLLAHDQSSRVIRQKLQPPPRFVSPSRNSW